MNNELRQKVCDIINKECTFQSWSKWYTVKNDKIHWDNDVCGGYLDDTKIFELLGQGREPIKSLQTVSRNNKQRV